VRHGERQRRGQPHTSTATQVHVLTWGGAGWWGRASPDRTLQSLVYKMVPTLKQRYEAARAAFYADRGLERPAEEVADTPAPTGPKRARTASSAATATAAASTATPPAAAAAAAANPAAPPAAPDADSDTPEVVAFYLYADDGRGCVAAGGGQGRGMSQWGWLTWADDGTRVHRNPVVPLAGATGGAGLRTRDDGRPRRD
jgi:hypothetical protein